MAKWLLNTGWLPNTCYKKNSSNTISVEKTFDYKLETFISGILIICENKQRNHLLYMYLVCVFETVFEQVIYTGWLLYNTGQDNKKSLVGTSENDSDHFIEVTA